MIWRQDDEHSPWGAPACPPDVLRLREKVAAFVRERVIPREPEPHADLALLERLRRQARA
ncbi:hypothetical protein GCM10009678_14870 [Actinomadura kijaniata]|uniref:Uncharacterized protein n=1 Tax=Actinomadura namibiensis TaxID=182080 RepID=A0A7W3LR09_ACTNM|nr:hypothetical protein [Actinomadura namibiensis]MBA8952652.1 hypothetical protein [Actinomadura namibiensis]